jgi:hypothetical protein
MVSEPEFRDDRWGPAVREKNKRRRKGEGKEEAGYCGLAVHGIHRAGRCATRARLLLADCFPLFSIFCFKNLF